MAGFSDGRESHYRRAAMFHPLRQRIARRLSRGDPAGAAGLSPELGEPPGRIAYHLRLLARRGALKVVPKRHPAPPAYRWSANAQWAREMLAEEDE